MISETRLTVADGGGIIAVIAEKLNRDLQEMLIWKR